MEKKVRAHAVISGWVQGVGFRFELMRSAQKYGVFGWAGNKQDGTVEAVFEGDKQRIVKILKWCEEGPHFAKVHHMDVEWENYTDEFRKFDIVR